MSKQMLFQHEWKISGLNLVCDKITGHPFIGSPVKDDDLQRNNNNSFYVYLSPKGYDQSCADYVSLWFSKNQDENCQIECKISILNNREVTLFVKDVIIIDNNTYLNEYIQRDYLFDPANGLGHNDEFILHFEGWIQKKKRSSIFGNNPPLRALTKDHFDFALLPKCANKFGLKWTIENVDELFFKNKKSNQILELPQYEDCANEDDKMIFSPRIEIVKEKSKGKRLVLDFKTNFCAPINVETSIIDSYKQKTHVKMSNHIDTTHFRYFIYHKFYLKHLLVRKNKLIFFTEITRITDKEICSNDNNNKSNYLQMLKYLDSSSSSSDLKITEFKIDAKTGEIFTLNPEIEQLEQLENVITEQTTALDNNNQQRNQHLSRTLL